MSTRLPLAAVALAISCAVQAADWPSFRGPNRDNISKETGLLKEWPKTGPAKAWTAKNLGEGFGTPIVAAGKVFGMGTRDEKDGVWALKESDGSEVWFTPIDKPKNPNQNNGPSGSPTFHDGKIYAISSLGKLVCLDANTGKEIWKADLVKDFGGRVQSWGYTESVLIDGDKLICTPGGKNTMVALNPATGEVIWKATVPKADAGGVLLGDRGRHRRPAPVHPVRPRRHGWRRCLRRRVSLAVQRAGQPHRELLHADLPGRLRLRGLELRHRRRARSGRRSPATSSTPRKSTSPRRCRTITAAWCSWMAISTAMAAACSAASSSRRAR